MADRNGRLLRHAPGEAAQGAGEPEVVEQLRPKAAADLLPHRVERRPSGVLGLPETGAQRGRGVRVHPLQLEQHRGQHLADLVVQLARHPPPLVLLGGERPRGAQPSLVLEAPEHRVERGDQLRHLRAGLQTAGRGPGRSGSTRRIVSTGARRREGHPQEEEVREQHRRQAADQDDGLAQDDR
jgi:hypothetical protein